MTRGTLRSWLCWALLGTHLVAIFFSVIAIGQVDPQETLNVILIMTPLTGAYLMIIVPYVIGQPVNDADDLVAMSKLGARVIIVITFAFGTALVGLLVAYFAAAAGYMPLIETGTLKTGVGVIETVLGVYVTMFVRKLFGGA